jgi:hypothetical protein
MNLTAVDIEIKILEDDRWLYRAILAVYARQTAPEQASRHTVERNGVGFSGVDAKLLSQFAEDLKKYGTLLQWKKNVARRKIIKYTKQLLDIAREKKGETK